MKTAFSTGVGLFAANTTKGDKNVPAGHLRFYFARIEAHGSPFASAEDNEKKFTLLPAMAQGNPAVAKALLVLLSTLEGNRPLLIAEASQ